MCIAFHIEIGNSWIYLAYTRSLYVHIYVCFDARPTLSGKYIDMFSSPHWVFALSKLPPNTLFIVNHFCIPILIMELKTPPWTKHTHTQTYVGASTEFRVGTLSLSLSRSVSLRCVCVRSRRSTTGKYWWYCCGCGSQLPTTIQLNLCSIFFRLPFCHIFIFHFSFRRAFVILCHTQSECNNRFARKGNFLNIANRKKASTAAVAAFECKKSPECRYIHRNIDAIVDDNLW